MDQMKIVIESLLTGSQFEVAVNEHEKILMLKNNIQKILGEWMKNLCRWASKTVAGQLVRLRHGPLRSGNFVKVIKVVQIARGISRIFLAVCRRDDVKNS